MPNHRIFDADLPDDLTVPFSQSVSGDEAHHAIRVKRVREGETLEILNGRGATAIASVSRIDKRKNVLDLLVTEVAVEPELAPKVIIASAVPKGSRADALVDQLSQAGVTQWVPVQCEYSVVDPRPGKITKWKRIAIESSKQSGRPHLLEISSPIAFADALERFTPYRCLVAHATGSTWREIECAITTSADDTREIQSSAAVVVLIGPEGGWSNDELDLVRAHPTGMRFITLGPHVMRIETAAIAAGILMRIML